MSGPLRVVHYVNQFFAGIGGEEQAHVGVSVRDGAGRARAARSRRRSATPRASSATIVCGDNFVSEQRGGGRRARSAPSSSAFGPTCSWRGRRSAPGATAWPARSSAASRQRAASPRSPPCIRRTRAVEAHRREVFIVPTGESATSMQPALGAPGPAGAAPGARRGAGARRAGGLHRPAAGAACTTAGARATSARSTCCSPSSTAGPSRARCRTTRRSG